MIEAKSLVKNYGDFRALDGISFKVERGEVVGLLGPNGAGKSTTMKILSAFMPASQGQVKVAGFDVFDEPMEVKKRVGYLPETPPLYPDMRVGEFLEFVAEIKHIASSKVRSRVQYVSEHCGLEDVQKKVIGTLSKGYKQRVGIAQSLIHDPEVVILDEPTVGLDPIQIIEIRNLIKALAESHTVILSTHILPEVVMTCGRILLINKGNILADGGVDEFTKNEGESLEQAYLRLIVGEGDSGRAGSVNNENKNDEAPASSDAREGA